VTVAGEAGPKPPEAAHPPAESRRLRISSRLRRPQQTCSLYMHISRGICNLVSVSSPCAPTDYPPAPLQGTVPAAPTYGVRRFDVHFPPL
jgi:hypothetical protein